MIPAIIESRFRVEKVVGRRGSCCKGRPKTVVHNGVKLTFTLYLQTDPTDEQRKYFMGLFLKYNDGPKEKVKVTYSVYAIRDSTEIASKRIGNLFHDSSHEFTRGAAGYGWPKIFPRDLTALTAQNCLCFDNRALHIMATLVIPLSAFNDPEKKYRVVSNPFFQSKFSQISIPIDTSSPYNFGRFDFISSDDQHFYVHKDVLAFNCNEFKLMFDPEKPEDAQFSYLKDGFMKLENLDGDCLREMFSFIYLGHVTPDFSKCAIHVLVGADMYGLLGLILLCQQELIAQTKKIQELSVGLNYLEVGSRHRQVGLIKASAVALKSLINGQKDIAENDLIRIIELSIEHKQADLMEACETKVIEQAQLLDDTDLTTDAVLHFVSIAKKYQLKKLENSCIGWFGKNWEKLMGDGLSALMEDKTDGLLPYIMGRALSSRTD